MRKLITAIFLSWLLFVATASIPKVRAILAIPLVVSDEKASGDACYVLAAGDALWERLTAASDLYHMNRVPKIFLMQNGETGPYNFIARANWTQTQWAVSYLEWKGVPKDRVVVIPEIKGLFGTLKEAQNIARLLPKDVKKLVLVTSAPHTRRSLFTFRKILPSTVSVIPYTASSFETSSEQPAPIWLEYLKLFIYKIYLIL